MQSNLITVSLPSRAAKFTFARTVLPRSPRFVTWWMAPGLWTLRFLAMPAGRSQTLRVVNADFYNGRD